MIGAWCALSDFLGRNIETNSKVKVSVGSVMSTYIYLLALADDCAFMEVENYLTGMLYRGEGYPMCKFQAMNYVSANFIRIH